MYRASGASLPIEAPRLVLRELSPDDLDAIQRYAADDVVTRFLCWGPNTREQTQAFIAQALSAAEAKPRLRYDLGIELRGRGELIGGCGIRKTGPRETWEIGYTLRRDSWGQGYGSEAVRALVGFGFESLGASRVVAEVFVENPGSSRILEKLRFRSGSTFVRHVACRDERHRARRFTLVRDAWLSRAG